MNFLATASTQYRLAKPETELELKEKYFKREAIEMLIDEILENAQKEELRLSNITEGNLKRNDIKLV